MYMGINRDALIKDLTQCVAEIRYINDQDTQRATICTLMRTYVSDETKGRVVEEARSDPRPNVIRVWDVQWKAWRTIPLTRVVSCQVKEGY